VKISIFTPTNNAAWIQDAYQSLLTQTVQDWEWVILLNGGASLNDYPALARDARVKVVDVLQDITLARIGALKRLACEAATGDVLLELDHDDLLAPTALEKVAEAFGDGRVGFVYSNCVRLNEDGSANLFDPAYGWQSRVALIDGKPYHETVSPDAVPQNLGSILFAPDHLRAWRADVYWQIGGHDQSLAVGDDHDLICRTYLAARIHHIDEPLYIYRIHGSNNWLNQVGRIGEQSEANWERYKIDMALRWAKDNGLAAVYLGCLDDCPPQLAACIAEDLPGAWPFNDGQIGVIFGSLAQFSDAVQAMNEAHRVLAHGGFLFTLTPSTDGRGAWCDPTQRSYWNELSFRYYTSPQFRRYIEPRATMKFIGRRLRTHFPSDWHRRQNVSYIQADLIAIKNGKRFHGSCEW
jgi:O-antigen biosynthesis protein